MPVNRLAKPGHLADDIDEEDTFSPNNSAMLDVSEKSHAWTKPAWAQGASLLKKTSKGQQMKQTGTLAKPIVRGGDIKDYTR